MARTSTTASAAAFAVVLLAMLIGACLLVSFGLVAAINEIPDGLRGQRVPAWWKFVAFGGAVVVTVAALPAAAAASRATRRAIDREAARRGATPPESKSE